MKGYLWIIGTLAIILVALITLSLYFERTLQMETAEQFNKQQLIIANQEASNIQDYLNRMRDELHHIAHYMPQFRAQSKADFKVLTDMLFEDKGYIKKRIEILDGQGKIIYTRGSVPAEGYDDRHFFDKARKLCPADTLVEHDTRRVTIVTPICSLDRITGAVLIAVDIQDLAKAFLSPGVSDSQTYSWMMDEKGSLLYHPGQPGMVGKNLFKTDSSCFKCHKSFELEKKIIEGRGDYCSGEHCGRYMSPTGENKILAYSTTSVGRSRWIIAVSAPYSEVTMAIKRSMTLYVWLIMLLVMSTLGVSAVLIMLNRKREQAEERAKHERELEMMHTEKLASFERLTSGITNEIGNPLSSVFSLLQALTDVEEDEFKKETLDTISLHMNKIEDILMHLSSYSKVPSLELKSCKVNMLIEDSLALIQYDKRVQEITVVRDLAPELPTIITDESQLSQVVVNLVLNAADAMPNGGTLTIRSRPREKQVVLEFEDTGVGIDKTMLGKIFDPFYTTKSQGTGLGLAVSHNIITRLKGGLVVESELNKGSKFMITLPLE